MKLLYQWPFSCLFLSVFKLPNTEIDTATREKLKRSVKTFRTKRFLSLERHSLILPNSAPLPFPRHPLLYPTANSIFVFRLFLSFSLTKATKIYLFLYLFFVVNVSFPDVYASIIMSIICDKPVLPFRDKNKAWIFTKYPEKTVATMNQTREVSRGNPIWMEWPPGKHRLQLFSSVGYFSPRETAPLEEKYCIQWNLYILNIKYLKHTYEHKSRFVNINKAYSLNSISWKFVDLYNPNATVVKVICIPVNGQSSTRKQTA